VKVHYKNGIHIEFNDGKRLLVDPLAVPKYNPDLILLTHAHADHAKGIKDIDDLDEFDMVMSEQTYGIKNRSIKHLRRILYPPIKRNGFTVTAYPSGHCLGSVQFKVNYDDKDIIFTGDFNVNGTLLEPKPQQLQGDILVTEANFGHPFFTFKPRFSVLGDIVDWVTKYKDKIKIMFMTGLGKAQELTQLFTQSELDQEIWVHSWYWYNNKIFEKYGGRLGRYEKLDKYSDISEGSIVIHPPLDRVDHFHGSKKEMRSMLDLDTDPMIAYVSGWAKWYHHEGAFPLSSHSDYVELMRYAVKSKARKIYTFHGFAERLANDLRERFGLETTHLTTDNYPDFITDLDGRMDQIKRARQLH